MNDDEPVERRKREKTWREEDRHRDDVNVAPRTVGATLRRGTTSEMHAVERTHGSKTSGIDTYISLTPISRNVGNNDFARATVTLEDGVATDATLNATGRTRFSVELTSESGWGDRYAT